MKLTLFKLKVFFCCIILFANSFLLLWIFDTPPDHVIHDGIAGVNSLSSFIEQNTQSSCDRSTPFQLYSLIEAGGSESLNLKNGDFSSGGDFWEVEEGFVTFESEEFENLNFKRKVANAQHPAHWMKATNSFEHFSNLTFEQMSDKVVSKISQKVFFSQKAKKIENLQILFVEGSLRRPDSNPLTECQKTIQSMCTRGYNDLIYFRVQFFDKNENRLSSTRSYVSDYLKSRWEVQKIYSLIPEEAAGFFLEVISNWRGGEKNEAKASFFNSRVSPALDSDGINLANEISDSLRIIKQPILRNPKHHTITIMWETNHNFVTHSVWYGLSEADLIQFLEIETTQIDYCHFIHKANIDFSHLSQKGEIGDKIFYFVQSGNLQSFISDFRFPDYYETETQTTVALVSDSQNGPRVFSHILEDLNQYPSPISLLIHLGDFVQNPAKIEEWHTYFWNPLSKFSNKVPLVVSRGNHDGEHYISHSYTDLINEQSDWYYFDWGDKIRFFILNSNCDPPGCPLQTKWLSEVLQKPTDLFKIVILHLPPMTELWDSKEVYNGEPFVREIWNPLFLENNVDIVISGHTHAYQRGKNKGVYYAIIGGAGGDLDLEKVFSWQGKFTKTEKKHHYVTLTARKNILKWTCYDIYGHQLDEFQIKK